MLTEKFPQASTKFILAGAPKSGSTSIYHYLSQHPEIFLAKQKELHYFSADHLQRRTGGPGDAAGLRLICRDADEYTAHFVGADSKSIKAVGDISPSYLYYAGVESRIKEELDDPFVLVILREPVERAYSQYLHLRRTGRESLSFEEAIDVEAVREKADWSGLWSYTGRSFYADHVERYRSTFGQSRFRVLFLEEMRDDPNRVLGDLFVWLGVAPSARIDTDQIHNAGGIPRSRLIARVSQTLGSVRPHLRRFTSQAVRDLLKQTVGKVNTAPKPEMSGETRLRLQGLFADDVARLETLLGRTTGWYRTSRHCQEASR